jgi:hypothetical protein
VFAIAEGMLPAQVQEAAEITVTTGSIPRSMCRPLPGAITYRAEGEAREGALSFDRMQRRLPMGVGRDGQPMFINADFLDGSRGAHVSISGISGVATKTSFATFLLYSVFTSGVFGSDAVNTKALIFNVKGEDLLFLDHPNTRLDEATRLRTTGWAWRPGRSLRSASTRPARAGDPSGSPDVASRLTGVDPFYWTLSEFCADRLLPYVFADADDERQQYTMVVHSVTAQLAPQRRRQRRRHQRRRHAHPQLRAARRLSRGPAQRRRDPPARGRVARSGLGTVNAFARRLISSKRDLARLIRGDLPARKPHRISTAEGAQVTVVDLHNLPDRAQRFVVA